MKQDSVFAAPSAWAVVNTQPHREHIALENLARQNFEAYCPLIRKGITHARRRQDVLRPLFPGYLFVQAVPRWRPILSTYGVRTVVHFGDQLAIMADGFVEDLKSHEVDGAIQRPGRAFNVGEKIRIAGGAFDGLIGIIVEMDEKDRLVVLMDLLNRPVKVKLAVGMVTAA